MTRGIAASTDRSGEELIWEALDAGIAGSQVVVRDACKTGRGVGATQHGEGQLTQMVPLKNWLEAH
jgi:hypothetical protein